MNKSLIVFYLLPLALLCSCVGFAPADEVCRVDSLNRVAYQWRYRNVDSSFLAARQAFTAAKHDDDGKAEASNHLAFCSFIRLDFQQAAQYHKTVSHLTQNELERLIADIGMMKICQRQALNKEYYDYRNSALRRLKRIDEDPNLFSGLHERERLIYARSEFCIVSAVYYYYLQQSEEAFGSIDEVDPNMLEADTNQLLYYHYIKGASELCVGDTRDERRLREFDELYTTWRMAAAGDYLYFEANGMQGLANLMISEENYAYFRDRRSYALKQFDVPSDSLLPLFLARQALQKFRQYGDNYQIAGAYVSIGKYLNRHERYAEALDTLKRALLCVSDTLNPVPECMSRIRDQLSVTYAGLGMKRESDINRNSYLDILEDTRQDREQESRYQALQAEAHRLSLLTVAVMAGFIGVGLLFWLFNRRGQRRDRIYLQHLRELIDTACSTWMRENDQTALLLADEQRRLEKQRYIYEQHIAEGKRQNVVKRACLAIVTGITPYIDRIINEVRKLPGVTASRMKAEKYQYIDELVTTINEYNDILADWIKLRQGTVSLHIETFALNELFDLLRKGSRAFELRRQTFEVTPTTAWVKADRALTLFMINTLSDNARKYTPQGGHIQIYATLKESSVEISVADTGYGLSVEDVERITNEKVYNPQEIGSNTLKEEVRKHKGSGFGLMNCRGIIEKYHKTSDAFRECTFGVESTLGKGSRFYFRLPTGKAGKNGTSMQ
jgi:signal transduction histidine kinase